MNKEKIPLISVIVPVYKVEKYLPACLDSLLAQTYRNFELIVVNDGSPDGCWQIMQRYAAQDARVRIFCKENGGVSSARNLGWSRQRASTSALWILMILCCRSIWNGCTMLCAAAVPGCPCAATAAYRKTRLCGR